MALALRLARISGWVPLSRLYCRRAVMFVLLGNLIEELAGHEPIEICQKAELVLLGDHIPDFWGRDGIHFLLHRLLRRG